MDCSINSPYTEMKRYESYKDSGVEWIGEIPSHWEYINIKYHTRLISGYPFDSNDITNEEREFPIIRIGNVTSGEIDVFYEGEYVESLPLVKSGDYIISLTGDFQIRRWDRKRALLNQRCGSLVSNKTCSIRFLFYYLPIEFEVISKTKYFTTLKNLSNQDVLNIKTTLPPISEQHQIVSFLDTETQKIENSISIEKRKIELLKEYRQSLISNVVTGKVDVRSN